MKNALQTRIQQIKTTIADFKAEFSLLQELKYLREILWQLK